MGASWWSYFVAYQPDLQAAFTELQQRVFAAGDYWWAAPGEPGRSASEYPDRPRTLQELFADERVQDAGTHSILDMERVLPTGQPPTYGWLAAVDQVTSPDQLQRFYAENSAPEYLTIARVTAAEALEHAGVEKLTRAHLPVIKDLVRHRGFGRCAVLHDDAGTPTEIYFWGISGD